ncbi:MAG: penicillin-binding protein 2 [Bacteroidetes bacterium]|nr:penicillin-binding protein 2 [Bacteroidota bacterium]
MAELSSNRRFMYVAVFAIIALIYLGKILSLQVNPKYELKAINNALNKIPLSPARSIIYDRNGKLMVYNIAIYDLWVFPGDVEKLDTAAFCEILNIDKIEFLNRMKDATENSKRRQKNGQFNRSAVFMSNLSKTQYASLQENIFQFPGFVIEPKTDRLYAVKGGAHVLGYLGEVSKKMLKNDAYYHPGDLVGITGIENTYEKYIRGIKGQRTVWQDRTYVERGEVKNDEFNFPAEAGPDIFSSLDFDLQEFGEKLLTNKRGSIVAIEPSTGEVLALINKPDYDPNLLVGDTRAKSFGKLIMDPRKPLYNRAIKGMYPPGSTFKTVMALVAQQEGVLHPETMHSCAGGYHMGSLTVGCHPHGSPLDLRTSIAISCNAYYCQVFRDIIDNPKYTSVREGYASLEKHLRSFGLGSKTGIDLPGENSGNIPSVAYLDKRHGKKWRSSNIISLAIGQGEILLTPLQMANVAAIIANRGFYYIPHTVRGIGAKMELPVSLKVRHFTTVDTQYFRPLIDGMERVPRPGGTAGGSGIPDIVICAKTGTAQNPHGEEHSLYIAFAPRENPKIAIAVVVENGGYGATWAAPMANLMIEHYLNKGQEPKVPYLLDRMLKGVVAQ